MKKKSIIRRFYHGAVNTNQFYIYGRNWVNVFFTFLTLMGSVGIIIIYLGLPQSPEMLLIITCSILIGVVIMGAILFKTKAQQVDSMMAEWRNPINTLQRLITLSLLVELVREGVVTIPEYFHKWGIRSIEDVEKTIRYSLKKGESAQSLSLSRKFFGVE